MLLIGYFICLMYGRVVTPRKKLTRDIREGAQFKPTYLHTTRPYVKYFRSRKEVDEFPFHTGLIEECLVEADYDEYYLQGNYHYRPAKSLTSKDVFLIEPILPYIPDFDLNVVAPRELDLLSPKIQESNARIPALYRITDKAVIDDYGRFYILDSGKWRFRPFIMDYKMRSNISLPGNSRKSVRRPCYFFSALAGYNPTVQADFLFSFKYQFHHIEENKLDIRPRSVVPIEYKVHEYLHANDLSPKLIGYFSYSKWIDV